MVMMLKERRIGVLRWVDHGLHGLDGLLRSGLTVTPNGDLIRIVVHQ
jgi:hypothetical protein